MCTNAQTRTCTCMNTTCNCIHFTYAHAHAHTHNLVHFTEVLVLWSLWDICSETLVHWAIHREPQQQLHTNRPQVEKRELSSREQHGLVLHVCSCCIIYTQLTLSTAEGTVWTGIGCQFRPGRGLWSEDRRCSRYIYLYGYICWGEQHGCKFRNKWHAVCILTPRTSYVHVFTSMVLSSPFPLPLAIPWNLSFAPLVKLL